MNSKYENIRLNYKIWLETQDELGILGDGKWLLLKAISETGSLKLAMEKLNLSYRKTWNNLQQIEERLGFSILDTQRGGADGGKTTLTKEGEKIVKAFDNFHTEFDTFIQQAFIKFKLELEEK
ncbi:MAG: winged helix-turn-helix domain-containing protein [Bacteroidales bacterium]|jgi:molybdate transport system regulatory protein